LRNLTLGAQRTLIHGDTLSRPRAGNGDTSTLDETTGLLGPAPALQMVRQGPVGDGVGGASRARRGRDGGAVPALDPARERRLPRRGREHRRVHRADPARAAGGARVLVRAGALALRA